MKLPDLSALGEFVEVLDASPFGALALVLLVIVVAAALILWSGRRGERRRAATKPTGSGRPRESRASGSQQPMAGTGRSAPRSRPAAKERNNVAKKRDASCHLRITEAENRNTTRIHCNEHLEKPVDHLAEVLKILDGALKSNHSMAANYAGLLADKLEREGSRREALMIRERLARAPAALAGPQSANLPVDGESRLQTLDVSNPSDLDGLVLPGAIRRRLDDFLASVLHHAELAAAGAALPNRLLLYGAPGTGKTATAKWLAARLQLPLLTARCDTLVSSLLGQTSRNLRRAFEYAQELPCVLFLDEFDALASARGNERDVGELQRIVIALLQNMDALPSSTILIAATNHEGLLDPAVWRRFSFQIPMPSPDTELRCALWRRFLGDYMPADLNLQELGELSEGLTGAAIEQACLDAKRTAILAGQATVASGELLRRLGMTIALTQRAKLTTIEDEIRWLRAWNPRHFTVRELAGIYERSTRQIMNTTKEEKDGDRRRRTAPKR